MKNTIRLKIDNDGKTTIQDVRLRAQGGGASAPSLHEQTTQPSPSRPGVGSEQNLNANPAIHAVMLNLSTNDARNALHELQRDEAEAAALKMCPPWTSPTNPFMVAARGLTYWSDFFVEGTTFLNDRLGALSIRPIPHHCEQVFGKFGGDIEPSFSLKMFIGQQWFAEVKRVMLAFGEQHTQQNVHFAYDLGSSPPASSVLHSLPEDVSCEYAWQVTMNTAQDITMLEKIAQEHNVFEYSLKGLGHVLLAYTTGSKANPQLQMPEKFKKMEQHLHSLFSIDGIMNLDSLVSKLKRPLAEDKLGQHLSTRLSKATRFLMSELETAPADEATRRKLTWSLATDFNRVIQRETLQDLMLRSGAPLSSRGRELLKKRPEGSDLIRNNRALLVEAYPKELSEVSPISDQLHWYIGLTNYGSPGYGATHTYEQAKQLLNSHVAK